jgi:hypothetical protein
LTRRTGNLGTSQRPGQRAIHDDGVRHEVPDARINAVGVDALAMPTHLTHDVGGHWALIDVEIVRPPSRSVVACDGRLATIVGCHWIVALTLCQVSKPLIRGK